MSCRYKLTAPILLWPFDLRQAEYFLSAAPLQALGVASGKDAAAALRLSLDMRAATSADQEISAEESRKRPQTWFSACRADRLRVYFAGSEPEAVALYEQIIAHRCGLWFRYLDEFGDPVVVPAPSELIVPIGFSEDEGLMPNDNRVFRGFDLLREYFVFPRKFLGFELTRLDRILPRLLAKSIDIVIAFDEINAPLAAAVTPQMFALYAAPAINLFEMTTDRVPIRRNQHEYHIVPDRSRHLDFEPHRILHVYAHFPGAAEKVPVRPLYSADAQERGVKDLFYTIRRLPRRRTEEERKFGAPSHYVGTDVFISISEAAGLEDASSVTELSVRALCSNRHLTEHLPVGEGRSDFRFTEDVTLDVHCVAGPTRPAEPIVAPIQSRTETASTGVVAWRLINMLSLNYLGLVEHGAGRNARALREMLAIFADMADSSIERRLRGVRSVEAKPVVRRLRREGGVGAARGTQITVTVDDKAFAGSGAFLLGAVLDEFLRQYAAFNNFTELVMRTTERGEIMRWPARIGERAPL